MSEVASAYVSLLPSFRGGASSIVKQVTPAVDSAGKVAGKRFGSVFSGSLRSVVGGALAGVGVTKLLSDSLGEARESQKVTALTVSTIKATGGAANVSAKQVGNLATAISNKVGVDDEAIQSGANMLLTFKNIRNEAGRGNDIFNQATKTTTDLAAAMAAASGGQLDFRSASIQMGKALNDPVKGVTALARVGVTFTEQQKNQIKALVASGNTMKAQKVILRELRSEFGGAAAAQATQADKARVAIGNLEEQIGTALLPVVDNLAQRVTKDVVPAVSTFVTQMQDGTGAGGDLVDTLKQTVGVGKEVVGFFNGLPGPVKKYGIEVGIAAVALGKLNTATGGLLTSARPAVGGMGRMSTAATSLRTGLANLAGAGGMLAVVDGAKRAGAETGKTSKSLGVLETTAGGAAAGLGVGGPLGAALGGVTGLMIGLYKATDWAAHGFENFKWESILSAQSLERGFLPAVKDYTATLAGVYAGTTRATRALELERMTKTGLLSMTQSLNISDRTAIQAALGNEAARKRVNAAIKAAISAGHGYQALQVAKGLGNESNALYSARIAQLEKNKAMAGTRAEAQRIQEKIDKLAAAHANPKISLSVGDTFSKLNTMQSMIHELTGKTHVVSIKQHVTGGMGALLGDTPGGRLAPNSAGRYAGVPTPENMQHLGKKLLEKLIAGLKSKESALKDQISSVTDQLDALTSASSDLMGNVAGNFMSDVFGGTLKSLRKGLATDTASAQSFLGALTTGISHGLSGAFYEGLARSGNVKLAQEIAALSPGDLANLQSSFNTRNAAADAVGSKVANDFYGQPVAQLTAEVKGMRADLQAVLKQLDRAQQIVVHDKSGSPKKTAREVARRQRFAATR